MSNIEMYGWDVVYASKISALNPNLNGVSNSFDESVSSSGNSIDVNATTNSWQITTGGSDAIVFFKVPCSSIKMSNEKKTFSFKNGYFLIQSNLKFVADNDTYHLIIDAGENKLKVLSASFPDSSFGDFEIYAKKGFQNWLNKQVSFPYNFISINTNAESDNSVVFDLKATSVNYAYIDTAVDDGILAVLCKTSSVKNNNQTLQQVSPHAIQSGLSSVLINKSIIKDQINNSNNLPNWVGSTNPTVLIENNLAYEIQIKNQTL